jgi:hypothetical protein
VAALSGTLIAVDGPASAATTTVSHTYSGGVKSSLAGGGAKHYNLDCANGGPGYVEGVGDNRTQPKITGKRERLVVHFQIAKNTASYAFLSRVVTSMTLRVEAPLMFSQPATYTITLYCTSDVTQAWRVLG